jgi:aspartate/methionine/tyrosine aminotransferase
MPRIADRVLQLGTETALDVLVKARALEARGRRVIHLEVGEPDFPTPGHIVEAGIRALRDGQTRYGPPAGLPELREAIAKHLGERGLRASPEHIVVAPGAKPLIFYGILATIGPGDEALVPDPGFPIYASMVRFCGGQPVPLDLSAPKITPRTKLVILNSPSNPTGVVDAEPDLRRLAELCAKHDLWVISDEIYRRIVYGAVPFSIASLIPERTVVVDGFSKCFAMTGWRLGYGLFPPALATHAVRLVVNSNTCTAAFVQHAGVAALRGPQDSVTAMVAEFRRRRDVIVGALKKIVQCRAPDGAFYAFPDVRALPVPASVLADRFLEEEGVAVLDGAGFGAGGAGHLRLSFAASLADLEEAAERFSRLVSRL